jgi:hypothetical protein
VQNRFARLGSGIDSDRNACPSGGDDDASDTSLMIGVAVMNLRASSRVRGVQRFVRRPIRRIMLHPAA